MAKEQPTVFNFGEDTQLREAPDGRLYIEDRDGNPKTIEDLDARALSTDSASTNLASETVTYIVYKDGAGDIIARNRDDASEEFSGSEVGTVIQDVVDNGLPDTDPGRGGRIHFTNDRYWFTSSVELGDMEVSITGENPDRTKLVQDADMDGIFTVNPSDTASHFVQFLDLKFNGQKSQNSKGSAVYATNAQDLHFIRCYAKKFAGDGIYADEVRGWRVRDSYLEQCAGSGMNVTGGGLGHIMDTRLAANGADGLVLNADNCTVRGNEFDDNSNGIDMDGSDNTIVGNPSFKNNDVNGVKIRGNGRRNKVANNTFNGASNTNYGVSIANTLDNVVENNTYLNMASGEVDDGGVRTIINGLGYNAGDPSSTGDWNGNGREGVKVRDTSNGNTYVYNNGTWSQIASA